MPRITQPGQPDISGKTGRITNQPTGFTDERIANTQIQQGRDIQQFAEQIFRENDQQFKTGQYNSAITNAQKEFNELYTAKMNSIREAKGNVDYNKLPGEIEAMRSEVLARHTSNILDVGVNQKVAAQFTHYTNNKSLEAVSTGTRLQEAFARESLDGRIALARSEGDIEGLTDALGSAVSSGFMVQDKASAIINEVSKDKQKDSLYNQMRTDPQGALKILNEMDPDNSLFDGSELLSMETRAKTLMSVGRESNKSRIDNTVKSANAQLKKARPLDDETIRQLKDLQNAPMTESQAAELNKTIDNAITVDLLLSADNTERNQIVNDLLLEPGMSENRKDYIKAIEKQILAAEKEDPVGQTIISGVASTDFGFGPETDIANQLIRRQEVADITKAKTGIDNVGLTKREITSLVANYEEGDTNNKMRILSDTISALGSKSEILFKQIKNEGGSNLAFIGSLVANGNESAAEMALKGAEIRKNNKNALTFVDKDFFEVVESDSMVTGPAFYTSDIREAARDIFYYKSSSVGDSSVEIGSTGMFSSKQSDEDRYKQSIKSIIGGEPIVWNNNKLAPPTPKYTEEDFTGFINSLNPADIDVLGQPEVEPAELIEGLRNQELDLMSVGNGKYVVIENILGVQEPVYNQDGSGFILDFDKVLLNRGL